MIYWYIKRVFCDIYFAGRDWRRTTSLTKLSAATGGVIIQLISATLIARGRRVLIDSTCDISHGAMRWVM
jgi:hypothetical protein